LHDAERRDTVRRIARAGDPDRALAALFAPRDARDDLFALYAFNVELARIAEQVSEPDLGAIRLQWWREAIEQAGKGEATGQPVADAFGAAMRHHALSSERIAALISARLFDIGTKIMPDWQALEAYLEDTASTLFTLAAQILGGRNRELETTTVPAGIAYGLTGLMRALPVHTAQGRVYLPADALKRNETSQERVLLRNTGEGLFAVLAELHGKAREALGEARHQAAELDERSRAAFLPLSLVEPYLAALEKKGRDPLRHVADINPLYRLWCLATGGWRGAKREGNR
jgi:15-cis-phytoene synthase